MTSAGLGPGRPKQMAQCGEVRNLEGVTGLGAIRAWGVLQYEHQQGLSQRESGCFTAIGTDYL